ncbi:hypothetical protein GLW08_03435 [Pontibacillus yanchengensis]|uniref:Uncharacterized protein n=2 Tax=Pontibacillus yanchengensis TaxID=462910 RepID=A0ACC7VCF9_9BACI|nr:hypothetical protein [Pontibacillus yanchengensis]MYL35358.1 hypothetical protein [Pontibacillus yanchengensis]MYL52387.1 hypothetical protein [Pontibacillus yanchengensis]
MNKHLEEVKQGIYINKDDPNYLEKWVRYSPNNRDRLYDYGVFLLEKGEAEKSIVYLQKASALGHVKAKRHLNQHLLTETIPTLPRWLPYLYLSIILAGFLALAFI